MSPPKTVRLRVRRAALSRLRRGHPWIYENSVVGVDPPGRCGDLAVVFDDKKRFLAVGLFDPDSPIRTRILQRGKSRPIDENWMAEHLDRCLSARQELFRDEETTGYRAVHGESDGWPALVLDRYGDTWVLKLYSLAWLPWLDRLLPLLPDGERIVLRLSRNMERAAEERFGRRDGEILRGSDPGGPVIFRESGLSFEADVIRGQKTGFFLDQRENRRRVGKLAAGRRVLNAFSFSGGFSLYAARGGARSVTDLDISAHALRSGARNFALNPEIRGCPREEIQGDVFRFLRETPERRFDLVVLDPPALARRKGEREKALDAYERLSASALPWLADGGILYAASCSAQVSADDFFHRVRRAASRSGRPFREVETTGHPPDHPAGIPEAFYLKGIFLRC